MRILVTVFSALLIAAPAALAKGRLVSAKVCGPEACRDVKTSEHTVIGGNSTDPPTRAEPFVRLKLEVGVPGRSEPVRMIFLPDSAIMRFEGNPKVGWVDAATPGPFRAAARGLKPYPAARRPAEFVSAIKTPPAPTPARSAVPATTGNDGSTPWWIALVAVPLALAALLARRRGRASTA